MDQPRYLLFVTAVCDAAGKSGIDRDILSNFNEITFIKHAKRVLPGPL